jgi:hypothetical protein
MIESDVTERLSLEFQRVEMGGGKLTGILLVSGFRSLITWKYSTVVDCTFYSIFFVNC